MYSDRSAWMSGRRWLDVKRVSWIWLGCCLWAWAAMAEAGEPPRPNVVLLYADDMGYGDLAIQNPQSKIRTPHLDTLAREGMRFTDAHSSSGVCTPSRYAMLTGRYHWRKFHNIVESWGGSVFSDEPITLPRMLKQAGYRTACIGKWHLGWDWDGKPTIGSDYDWTKRIPGGPTDQGFDYYFGDDVPNFPPYTWFENDHVLQAPTVPYVSDPVPAEGAPEGRPGPMVEGWRQDRVMPTLTEKAVAWIHEQQGKDEPFFLYFPWTSPHAPIVPTQDYQGTSQAGGFGDFMQQSDDTAGKVLQAIEDCGFRENTIVIFTSDNGPETYAFERWKKYGHRSSGPLRGVKRDIWEGGHRVPCVVRWPGKIPAGSVQDGLISQIDFLATLVELIGFHLETGMAEDSHSQLPMWLGTGGSSRTSMVHNTQPNRFAIRSEEWVLIDAASGEHSKTPAWYNEDAGYRSFNTAGLLFDLRNDLAQKENRYDEFPERVREMRELLKETRQRGEVR